MIQYIPVTSKSRQSSASQVCGSRVLTSADGLAMLNEDKKKRELEKKERKKRERQEKKKEEIAKKKAEEKNKMIKEKKTKPGKSRVIM